MSDKIKVAGEIYEKDLYGDLSKSAKEVIPLLEEINSLIQTASKQTSKVINIEAKDIKSLNAVNDAIEDTNDLFEEKLKLDKKVLQNQKLLNEGNKIDAKILNDLELKTKGLTAEKNKLLKQQIKADKQRADGNEKIAKQLDLTIKEREELYKVTQEITVACTS